MRVATDRHVVTADPGTTAHLTVDVVNTGQLIDGVTAQLVGLDVATVRSEPMVLPLFPDATGQITLAVDIPSSLPAGLHPVAVEVVSHVSGETREYVDIELSISAAPGLRLSRNPAVKRTHRKAQFVLSVENTGNVALDVQLKATTPEKVTTAFSPATLRVEPGGVTPVMLTVRGPRMITGSEVDRPVTVNLTGRRVNTIPAMDETESEPELTDEALVTVKQRPMISRGLLTALILASIVALWAAVFLLGLTQVFKGDPMTKTAPASYFPVAVAEGLEPGSAEATAANAKPPAGATAKTGIMAPGVGGEIDGIVTAKSNSGPVGRILVQAYRQGRHGPVLVSSAATQSDGSYVLAGLFPTTYWLKFSADGFDTIWSPSQVPPLGKTGKAGKTANAAFTTSSGSLSLSAATKPGIAVQAQAKVAGANVVINGKLASISGAIDPGDSLTPVTTTVTARMLDGGVKAGAPITATTDSFGHYDLKGLKSPGTYELSFTTPGYQVTTQTETVNGGEQRLEPTVLLSAQDGTLSGTVTNGAGKPIGGVTVSTTVAGQAISVVTPTVGDVGVYTFDNLPTPGTYVVTFTSKDGSTATRIVDIPAGSSGIANATLVSGTGSVTGILCMPKPGAAAGGGCPADTVGAGGATVTVGGTSGGQAPATMTLTSGTPGSFAISGLAAPGSYTLTFSLDGYEPEIVPVTLTGTSAPAPITAQLHTAAVRVCGSVTKSGSSAVFVGAKALLTDGPRTWSTTVSGPSDQAAGTSGVCSGIATSGGYLFPGVPAGTYSLTITAAGYTQQTAQVVVTSTDVKVDNVVLKAGS